MRRSVLGWGVALAVLTALAALVYASEPRFVTVTATPVGDTLHVSFTVAGLGHERHVHVDGSAVAMCVTGSGRVGSTMTETVIAHGAFLVENGGAGGTVHLTPRLRADCPPPLSIQFSDVVVEELASEASARIPGTF